jgi:hypothetical protein
MVIGDDHSAAAANHARELLHRQVEVRGMLKRKSTHRQVELGVSAGDDRGNAALSNRVVGVD